MRFVVEGFWSGYVSRQSRVVHRTVVHGERCAENISAVHTIQYTDGTTLSVSVRPCTPRERVQENDQYSTLIAKASRYARENNTGFVRVQDLP